MELIFNEGGIPEKTAEDKMTEAARLCLEREDIDPENVEISVSFVSEEEIKELNKIYRNNNSVTDVLSFPQYDDLTQLGVFGADETNDDEPDEYDEEEFFEAGAVVLGDVVICREKAKEQAAEFGHSEERELIYLFVHSMFHLLGYDHMDEEDKKEMRQAEEDIMAKLDLTR